MTQEAVRESERRRFGRVEDVDDVLALDLAWREARHALDEVGGEFNKANKEVAMLMKAGKKDEAAPLMAKVKEIDERKKAAAEKEKELEEKTTTALLKIGNIVHDSVATPYDLNITIGTEGTMPLSGQAVVFDEYLANLKNDESDPVAMRRRNGVYSRDFDPLHKSITKELEQHQLIPVTDPRQGRPPRRRHLLRRNWFLVAPAAYCGFSLSALAMRFPTLWGVDRAPTLALMEMFAQRTQGTYVETHESCLVWQYRDADPDYGEMQAAELEAAHGEPGKYTEGLMMREWSACDEDEDVVTMALTAVRRLVERCGVRWEDIGMLQVWAPRCACAFTARAPVSYTHLTLPTKRIV